jgi:hypothetical protein
MRWSFLLSIPLVSLLLLAACGGGGNSQPVGPIIQDPEAVVLDLTDLPLGMVTAGEGGIHVTNEQACSSATDENEKQACIDRLNSWGRRDHYQVMYASNDPDAILSGIFQILVGVSVYDTVEGATASFDYSAKRLEDLVKDKSDTSIVQAERVGDESVTWVTNTTETLSNRDVPISSYVVDFRRGNTIVRTQVAIAKALGSADEAVKWGRLVDTRILSVSGWQSILGSPEPSVTATP